MTRHGRLFVLLLSLLAAAPAVADTWSNRPSAARMAEVYPKAALKAGEGGRVVVQCRFRDTGRLGDCKVLSEDPPGRGFAAAALALTPQFQTNLAAPGATAKAGSTIRIPIRFVPTGGPSPMSRAQDRFVLSAAGMVVVLALILGLLATLTGKRRELGAAFADAGRFTLTCFQRAPAPIAVQVAGASLFAVFLPVSMGAAVPAWLLAMAGLLMIHASGLRIAFPGDKPFALKRGGLQFGRLEGRAILAMIGLSIVATAAAIPFGVVIMVILATSTLAGFDHNRAGTPFFMLGMLAAAYAAIRLTTFVPATIHRGGVPITEAWRAGRGHVLVIAPSAMALFAAGLAAPRKPDGSGPLTVLALVASHLAYAAVLVFALGVAIHFYRRLQAQTTAPEA